MSSPYLAQIQIYPYNFAPRSWAWCNGQLMPISQMTALFSLLGTMYGGDGRTTFGLPALQGRVPIGQGQGPGLSSYDIGQMGGFRDVTLVRDEMPKHQHSFQVSRGLARERQPPGQLYARGQGIAIYGPTGADEALSSSAAAIAGASLPHNNMQPFLALNYCIALEGVWPPRPEQGAEAQAQEAPPVPEGGARRLPPE